jgi:hypothetical protein
MQAFVLRIFTKPDVARILTSVTLEALMLEEYRTNTLSNLEFCCRVGAYLNDSPRRLMRGYDRQFRLIDAFIHLVVGVAKSRCSDLDENIVVSYLRYGNFIELKVFVELMKST